MRFELGVEGACAVGRLCSGVESSMPQVTAITAIRAFAVVPGSGWGLMCRCGWYSSLFGLVFEGEKL